MVPVRHEVRRSMGRENLQVVILPGVGSYYDDGNGKHTEIQISKKL
jgi:hypothetical protein